MLSVLQCFSSFWLADVYVSDVLLDWPIKITSFRGMLMRSDANVLVQCTHWLSNNIDVNGAAILDFGCVWIVSVLLNMSQKCPLTQTVLDSCPLWCHKWRSGWKYPPGFSRKLKCGSTIKYFLPYFTSNCPRLTLQAEAKLNKRLACQRRSINSRTRSSISTLL